MTGAGLSAFDEIDHEENPHRQDRNCKKYGRRSRFGVNLMPKVILIRARNVRSIAI